MLHDQMMKIISQDREIGQARTLCLQIRYGPSKKEFGEVFDRLRGRCSPSITEENFEDAVLRVNLHASDRVDDSGGTTKMQAIRIEFKLVAYELYKKS